MEHASDDEIGALIAQLARNTPEDPIPITRTLVVALVDEVQKHRARQRRAAETAERRSVEIETLLSSRTKTGAINLFVNGEAMQLDVAKAREVSRMLVAAIEAAVSDELIYRFLRDKVGLSDDAAARALLDFRELRQGSRDTVNPS
jgi:hypothetical protein